MVLKIGLVISGEPLPATCPHYGGPGPDAAVVMLAVTAEIERERSNEHNIGRPLHCNSVHGAALNRHAVPDGGDRRVLSAWMLGMPALL